VKTVTEILWLFNASLAAAGICLGAAQIIRSGFLFLAARGQSEQIAKAKSILWHALAGMAILAGTFIFIVLIHFD
jgi:hypothetical protein